MSGSVFERYELKYLLSKSQRRALEQQLGGRVRPDIYGESTVCSVYYDTPDFRLIRASLEKPVYKEKLRLRSYGPAQADQPVFLELKKKYDGVVYKRRICLPLYEAESFFAGADLAQSGQIGRELTYCRDFYGVLRPTAAISYDRSAFFGREDDRLRITFDRSIRCRWENLTLSAAPSGTPLLEAGHSLLEVKVPGAMPLWLSHLLGQLHIRPVSFSKYGTAYQRMLKYQIEMRGVFCV